ncbi:Dorsal-ventral patterning tolloid-like protein 1 [Bulinus truncatus]|nr:Dorsal-ventral patterning tolloid-like protein 1 [Bulinus truncatus]
MHSVQVDVHFQNWTHSRKMVQLSPNVECLCISKSQLKVFAVIAVCHVIVAHSIIPINEQQNNVQDSHPHQFLTKSISSSFKVHSSHQRKLNLENVSENENHIISLQKGLSHLSSLCAEGKCRNHINYSRAFRKKIRKYEQEIPQTFKSIEPNDIIPEDQTDTVHSKWTQIQYNTRLRRAATALKEKHWDYGVIPYYIEPIFNRKQKDVFILAMGIWEEKTCVIFKEKEPEDKNYLIFTVRPCGCCSYVGNQGNGAQPVSIGKNCDKLGIVLHELGHAIGFWHEHTRPDRDKFVEILLDNVQPDKKTNFNAMNDSDVDSLDETYDFESIMHYSRNNFAKSPYLDTILPHRLPGSAVRPGIGQRSGLSAGDIRQARKLYSCPNCGGTLFRSSGSVEYVAKLGQPELCQWRIVASYGERVKLNITSLDVTYSDNCEKNYLEIRDGYYVKSPLIGRYCGNSAPPLLTSSGRRMWIEFKTNGGLDKFSAEYFTLCGGNVVKDEDVIASPSYPHNYIADSHCVWNITVPAGFVVVLTFEYLDLEFDDNCTYDFVEVRDGHGQSAKPLGRYCGYEHPKEIRSTENTMSLLFVSDSEIHKTGFAVHFIKEKDECNTDDHECDHVCINTIGSYKCECRLGYELHSNGKTCKRECGGHVYDKQGNITSPSFPDNYPSNKVCIWHIITHKDQTVTLNFTHFDLEGDGERCFYDYVSIYRDGGKDPGAKENLCGNTLPKPIVSQGNVLKIEFRSDGYDQKSGFVALFSTDKNECEINNGGCDQICKNTVGSYQCSCVSGYILQSDHRTCLEGCRKEVKAPKGNITSPDYPIAYPRNMECEWLLSTVLGHRVRLSFKVLDLEPHVDCIYDNVLIYDGDNRNSSILGRFCGSTFPEQIISTGTTMMLLFTTDNSVQRKGFEAEHDTVCGATLLSTFEPQTLVSHPSYGSKNYDVWADCQWLFVAPDGLKVEIDFEFFNLESQADCQYDYVAIYDGDSDNSTLLGVHCGRSVPLRIVSSKNTLFLVFMTDNTINKRGFQLRFQTITTATKRTELVD